MPYTWTLQEEDTDTTQSQEYLKRPCKTKPGPRADVVREKATSHSETHLNPSARIQATPRTLRGMPQNNDSATHKHLVLSGPPLPLKGMCFENSWFQGLTSYHTHRPLSQKVRRYTKIPSKTTTPTHKHESTVVRARGSERQHHKTTSTARGHGTAAQRLEDTKTVFQDHLYHQKVKNEWIWVKRQETVLQDP